MNSSNHLDLLGMKVKDKVTGFSGVVSSVSFDLFGCIQAAIAPPMDKSGLIPDGRWFDVTRIEITDKKRVMDAPDFYQGYVATGKKGAAEKPAP